MPTTASRTGSTATPGRTSPPVNERRSAAGRVVATTAYRPRPGPSRGTRAGAGASRPPRRPRAFAGRRRTPPSRRTPPRGAPPPPARSRRRGHPRRAHLPGPLPRGRTTRVPGSRRVGVERALHAVGRDDRPGRDGGPDGRGDAGRHGAPAVVRTEDAVDAAGVGHRVGVPRVDEHPPLLRGVKGDTSGAVATIRVSVPSTLESRPVASAREREATRSTRWVSGSSGAPSGPGVLPGRRAAPVRDGPCRDDDHGRLHRATCGVERRPRRTSRPRPRRRPRAGARSGRPGPRRARPR